ncbi:MAG: CoA-binding protein [Myxococcota bacterium]|jgi:predicted CoA-binding protein|nr:CoA-binding protein [Myxococcota bacterium]
MRDPMDEFLSQPAFAVAGASTDRAKYGNKVVRAYLQQGRSVLPINPKADEVEGVRTVRSVADLPSADIGLSIVTPPAVTREVVEQALSRGIRHLWMQPGAENEEVIALAQQQGAIVLHGGPCVLVALGYRE